MFAIKGEHFFAYFGGWGENASHIGSCINQRPGEQAKRPLA